MKKDKVIKYLLFVAIILQLAVTGFMSYTLYTYKEKFNAVNDFVETHCKTIAYASLGVSGVVLIAAVTTFFSTQ